ncbi:hypothetical protein [Actinoplanes sp. N902-109]|uniref:hypothetical protein n=1 Tax=Actinoplanes sp. (strain N902-109) TaxID=649831 RepID=UPI000329410E|nr:hypothetical protein [Actinoplanes sp. N902-109]AGL21078.1 hypothetical protein L083_7568 [Actinoplanes sp. N902-109]
MKKRSKLTAGVAAIVVLGGAGAAWAIFSSVVTVKSEAARLQDADPYNDVIVSEPKFIYPDGGGLKPDTPAVVKLTITNPNAVWMRIGNVSAVGVTDTTPDCARAVTLFGIPGETRGDGPATAEYDTQIFPGAVDAHGSIDYTFANAIEVPSAKWASCRGKTFRVQYRVYAQQGTP